jgi:CheY-like chemotaxis protein
VLIVAETEGFIVKGIETKLKNIGIESVYSSPRMKDLEGKLNETDLVMLYTDDKAAEYATSLVYIKDRCAELDEQVIVIGAKIEFDIVKGFIPESHIFKFYERPLDMETLLNDIEKYLESEAQYARRKSILIVDDDVSYMSMVMDWLKEKYRVSTVNSGIQAIKWLAKNHADLVLLDYEMPVTTGPQVLEMIRSDDTLADLPVMFLTGKSDKESVMQVVSLKPEGYFLKNIQKDELLEKLNEFFILQK